MSFFSKVKGMWTIAISVGRGKKEDGQCRAKRVDFKDGQVQEVSDYKPERTERVHEPRYRLVEEASS